MSLDGENIRNNRGTVEKFAAQSREFDVDNSILMVIQCRLRT